MAMICAPRCLGKRRPRDAGTLNFSGVHQASLTTAFHLRCQNQKTCTLRDFRPAQGANFLPKLYLRAMPCFLARRAECFSRGAGNLLIVRIPTCAAIAWPNSRPLKAQRIHSTRQSLPSTRVFIFDNEIQRREPGTLLFFEFLE